MSHGRAQAPPTAPALIPFDQRPHILVVDDDDRIRELVSRYLREQQFIVLTAANAAEARTMLQHFSCDAMVVDVMMPGETGVEFTRGTRKAGAPPVILLTALGEIEDKVAGLEAGADDYLPKPFEPRELVARLNALLRRSIKITPQQKSFRVGRWHFDPAYDELSNGGETVRLTTVEARLLRALAAQAGQVMSREMLAAACDIDAGERTIDVQVTRLRRKIEDDPKAPRALQTLRGKGYLLRIEDL